MFEHEKVGELDVVRVNTARMDASNASEFLSRVELLIGSGSSDLVVDFNGVTFMDSSALGATVSALKKIGSRGSMTLVGVGGLVADLFKLTRMDRVFNIANDLDEVKLAQSA